MSFPYTVRIKGADFQEDRIIAENIDSRLVALDVELHNRDNPDDPWVSGELAEEETAAQ